MAFVGLRSPLPRQADLGLSVASFTETEELEDDPLGSSGQDQHAVLQLLVSPLEQAVQGPQVLDGRHVEEVAVGQPRVERLEFICYNGKSHEAAYLIISILT